MKCTPISNSDFTGSWLDEAIVGAGRILGIGAVLCRADLEAAAKTGLVAHDLTARIDAMSRAAETDAAEHAAAMQAEAALQQTVDARLADYRAALKTCRKYGERRLAYIQERDEALPGLPPNRRLETLRSYAEGYAARRAEADACYQLLVAARAAANEKKLANAARYSKGGGAHDDWGHSRHYLLKDIERLRAIDSRVGTLGVTGLTPEYIAEVEAYFTARESIIPLTGRIIKTAKRVCGEGFADEEGEFSDMDRAQLFDGAYNEVAAKLKIFRPLLSIADARRTIGVLDAADIKPYEFVRVFDTYIGSMLEWGIRAALRRIKLARGIFVPEANLVHDDPEDAAIASPIELLPDPAPAAPRDPDVYPDEEEEAARIKSSAIAGIDGEEILDDVMHGIASILPSENILRVLRPPTARAILREILVAAIGNFAVGVPRAERDSRLLDIIGTYGFRQEAIIAQIISATAHYLIGTQIGRNAPSDDRYLDIVGEECERFLAAVRRPHRA